MNCKLYRNQYICTQHTCESARVFGYYDFPTDKEPYSRINKNIDNILTECCAYIEAQKQAKGEDQ